jgi:hypothetical protein
VCSRCGDRFKTRFSLKRHRKKHTGEKPFVCDFPSCRKRFAEKSTLIRHERVHTGEKRNTHKHAFLRASRLLHLHSPAHSHHLAVSVSLSYLSCALPAYICSVYGCGKRFADRTNVKRHEMIHSGVRPYRCPAAGCTRGYFWRKHLTKHISSVHKNLPLPQFDTGAGDEDGEHDSEAEAAAPDTPNDGRDATDSDTLHSDDASDDTDEKRRPDEAAGRAAKRSKSATPTASTVSTSA